jgi:hypothetical protein
VSCTFVPASPVHIGPIAVNMREADRIECHALGRTPKEALRSGLRCSLEPMTALDPEGRPQAMMGVVPASMLEGRGTVWMLGSDVIYEHGRDLITFGPPILEHWLTSFRRLENVVAVKNVKAIRLLQRWGFTVDRETELWRGVAFRHFHIVRPAIQATALAA